MKTAGGINKAGIDAAAVGTRQPRLDGPEKVSGRALFTDDVRPAACCTERCCAANTSMRVLSALIRRRRKRCRV